MLKRITSFLLCFILILAIVPANVAMAELSYIRFDDGAIEMRFRDTEAGSGTTYHTVGWMLHKKAVDGRNAYNTDPVGIMLGTEYQQTNSMPVGGGKVQTDFYIDSTAVGYAQASAKL